MSSPRSVAPDVPLVLVQVRVALERIGEVRAERRVRGLVLDEVVLRRERQPRDVLEALEREQAAQALALERVVLGEQREQVVEPPQALGIGGHGLELVKL